MAKRRFNYKPLIVLVISLAVLAATVFWLRNWQRKRTAYTSHQTGLTAFQNHHWENAAINLGRYIAANPTDLDALSKYAQAQFNRRPMTLSNIKQVIATYRSILRIDKNDISTTRKLISIYLQMNIATEAELIAERYLQTHNDPEIGTMLAMALAEQRKLDEAIEQLRSVLQSSPEHINAYEVLGRLSSHYPDKFKDHGQYWFDHAVKNNPASAEALIARAGFYIQNKNVDRALSDLEESEKLNLSDPRIRLRLAEELINAVSYHKAQTHLSMVLTEQPDNLKAWQKSAEIVLKKMSKDQMLKTAENGLKALEPDTWDFMPSAVELFIQCEKFEQAQNYLDKLKQKEVQPTKTAYLEGLLAKSQDQHYKAIKFWQKAQESGDNSDKTAFSLANAYLHTGDSQSAISQLRILTSEKPYFFQGHLELAKLLGRTGQWAQAAETARLAIQLVPENTDAVLLHLQARIKLIENDNNIDKERTWKQIQNQLDSLEGSAVNTTHIKLMRFQLAIQKKDFASAKQILSSLKPDDTDVIDAAMAEIDLLIAQDKIDEAISRLNIICQRFDSNILPVKYLAVLLNSNNDRRGCEKTLETAIARTTNSSSKRELGILLADLYGQWDQPDKQEELLKKLLQEMPEDIPLMRQLLKYKDTSQAQLLVDRIKVIEGEKGWQWRYEQAVLWLKSKDFKSRYPEIIELLKKNLIENPSEQTSRLLLAQTYDKAGQLQLAVAMYRHVLTHSPDDIQIIVPAIETMYKAKEYTRADEILNRVSEQKPEHPWLCRLKLQSCIQQGKLGSAETILEDLAAEEPADHSVSFSLALVKIRLKKYQQAREILNKLRISEPDSFAISAALVDLNIRQKKNAEAIALCDEIVTRQKSADAYIFRGNTYLSIDRITLAEKDFDKAVSIEPDNVNAWTAKSYYNQSIGEFEKACQDIQKGLSLEPENIQIQKLAITLLLSSEHPENVRKGKKILETALTAKPQNIDLRLYKAQVLLSQKNNASLQQAENILQQITQQHPRRSEPWVVYTQFYLERAEIGKAMDTIMRGLTYCPDDKNLLLQKAKVESARSPALAIPTLENLYLHRSDDIDIALELAETYIRSDQSDHAVDLLQNLLIESKQNDHAEIYTELAAALYKNGRKTEAIEKFDLFYQTDQNTGQTILAHAEILRELRDWQELDNRIKQWLQKYPDNTHIFIDLATRLAKTENDNALRTAESLLRKILEHKPDNLEAISALAMLLQITGNFDESASLYKKILNAEPDSLIAINNLAWIMCEHQGKYDQALRLAQRGLDKAPEYIDLLDTRGVVYYRLGINQKAIEDFAECIELRPENSPLLAVSYFHMANAMTASGQNELAVDNMRKALELNKKTQSLSPAETAEAKRLFEKLSRNKNYGSLTN